MIVGYGDGQRLYPQVARLFNEAHIDRNPMVEQTSVLRILRKLKQTGHVKIF